MTPLPEHTPYLVIGAGPAGLTAAFKLAKAGHRPLVLEASPHIGGISRTHCWGDNRIDIGGHRFFTKSAYVQRLWAELMDEPMLQVPRLSRIFYRDKFYQYPLQIPNTVGNLGPSPIRRHFPILRNHEALVTANLVRHSGQF